MQVFFIKFSPHHAVRSKGVLKRLPGQEQKDLQQKNKDIIFRKILHDYR